jgi:hypothetical protein
MKRQRGQLLIRRIPWLKLQDSVDDSAHLLLRPTEREPAEHQNDRSERVVRSLCLFGGKRG